MLDTTTSPHMYSKFIDTWNMQICGGCAEPFIGVTMNTLSFVVRIWICGDSAERYVLCTGDRC